MRDVASPDWQALIDAQDLDGMLATVWSELAAAVGSGRHPWHLTVLGTSAQACNARTVVLRHADPTDRSLMCHTDARSPKAQEVAASPNTVWLCYDPAARVQIRAYGHATVHTDDRLADEHWAASTLDARRCYLAPHSPGARLDEPLGNLPEHLRDRPPTEDEAHPGRKNFCVIRAVVQDIDWLQLNSRGHLRAGFRYQPDGAAEGHWIAP